MLEGLVPEIAYSGVRGEFCGDILKIEEGCSRWGRSVLFYFFIFRVWFSEMMTMVGYVVGALLGLVMGLLDGLLYI